MADARCERSTNNTSSADLASARAPATSRSILLLNKRNIRAALVSCAIISATTAKRLPKRKSFTLLTSCASGPPIPSTRPASAEYNSFRKFFSPISTSRSINFPSLVYCGLFTMCAIRSGSFEA